MIPTNSYPVGVEYVSDVTVPADDPATVAAAVTVVVIKSADFGIVLVAINSRRVGCQINAQVAVPVVVRLFVIVRVVPLRDTARLEPATIGNIPEEWTQ